MNGLTLSLVLLPAVAMAQPAPEQLVERKPAVELSLKQAVEIALAPEGNARVEIARELVRQAETRSAQARAALLPNLDAYVSEQSITRNLAAFGIQFAIPVPGFALPTRVGPFNNFDVRATATQSIFDLSTIRRFQASRAGMRAAAADRDGTEDQIAAQVAKAYLAAAASDSRLDAARANVALAQALVALAENQKAAGTGTGLDVTRSEVQLANEKQALLVASNARRAAHLQLLRAMGLNLATDVDLTDTLAFTPADQVTVEQARATADQSRSDLKAQRDRENTARLSYSATKLERVPSLVSFADYGTIGTGISNALPTRTYGVSLRLPIFDGGRRDARRAESLSVLRQEQVKTGDLKEQVDLEIRLALDSLDSATEQVKVAEEGLRLAQDEVGHAERRYKAGVSNSIELTDAQTRLARARENRIAALLNYNTARIDLGQAMGTTRRTLR